MIIQPTKAKLVTCTISGVPYVEGEKNNFHVQELRIFEDHCKAYFTGQLVIEAHQNTWEIYVNPAAEVVLTFEAPRSDGGPTKSYTEKFQILSYESKPREGDLTNAMVITLSLIGPEYYNDKFNTVQQSFANIPGTAAAAAIHGQYMAENGGLDIRSVALGMIGMDQVPHQVRNKKPIKAIHDILDKSVFAAYKSGAAVYFRNKPGYVMGPLQQLMETAPVTQTFIHQPAESSSFKQTMLGYDKIIHLRPMAPPGQDNNGMSAGSIDGLFKSLAFFDLKSGNYEEMLGNFGGVVSGLASSLQGIASSMQAGIKGRYGGRNMMATIDDLHQARSVAKNGPGGWKGAEDSFLTALRFSPKYWISAPLQTGVNVTCGDRINVSYPIANAVLVNKTLYVARLIHELRFTEGKDRRPVTVIGTTDMFCVHWS